MAGKLINGIGETTIVSANSSGYVELASVSGYYVSAQVFLNATGAPPLHCEIVSVDTTNNLLGVRRVRGIGEPPWYGRDNVAAYDAANDGTISMPPQLIYNPNEGPLT